MLMLMRIVMVMGPRGLQLPVDSWRLGREVSTSVCGISAVRTAN